MEFSKKEQPDFNFGKKSKFDACRVAGELLEKYNDYATIYITLRLMESQYVCDLATLAFWKDVDLFINLMKQPRPSPHGASVLAIQLHSTRP